MCYFLHFFFVLLKSSITLSSLSFSFLLERLLTSAAEPDEEVVKGLGSVGHRPANLASELRGEGRQEQVGKGVQRLARLKFLCFLCVFFVDFVVSVLSSFKPLAATSRSTSSPAAP